MRRVSSRDTEDYNRLQAALIIGLAENDVIAARQLADQLPAGYERDRAYATLVRQHANTNPAEAAAWISTINDESQRSGATTQVVFMWYSQNPDAAQRWISNLPNGNHRDDAIVGLAQQWTETKSSQNLLIDSISNPAKKVQAQSAQIYQVSRRDWRRAQSMLDDLNLPDMERQRIQRTIDHQRNR
jgi:hypothetical protein